MPTCLIAYTAVSRSALLLMLTCILQLFWYEPESKCEGTPPTRQEDAARLFVEIQIRQSVQCRHFGSTRLVKAKHSTPTASLFNEAHVKMPGGDRTQHSRLLRAGDTPASSSAGLRAKPRPGPPPSFASLAAVTSAAKRAVASQLRAPDLSRKAPTAGRSVGTAERGVGAAPSAIPLNASVDNNVLDVPMRTRPSGSARTTSSSTAMRGRGSTQLKRIGDLVKRAQPHTIVQTYDKILRMAQLETQLIVNGEALTPDAAGAASLQLGWQHRGEEGGLGERANVATGFFDPKRGRFHYSLGFRFSHVDPALSLSTITDIALGITSSASSAGACRPCLFTPLIQEECNRPADRTSRRIGPAITSKAKLSIKAWRFIAEAPARVGLALYELPVRVAPKSRSSSSVLALVWTRNHARLEVVTLFAQLHVSELLAGALILSLSRPSLVVPLNSPTSESGDGDENDSSSTGLRGFTMALTLRTLDRVIWEHEWYQVDFPRPLKADCRGGRNTADTRVVTLQLLDEHGVFRDRARYAEGSVALAVETDAITLAIDSAVVVDFCAWEESAIAPVWGFSRPARIAPTSAQAVSSSSETLGGDFSLTAAGKTHELLEAQVTDATITGNQVTVHLVKTRAKTSGESNRVLIKQVNVSMGVAFLNATFGTSY